MPRAAFRPVILFVEDDPFAREQTADFLRDVAARVVVAADGKQGLALYRDEAPDIVITDVLMPVMNGLEMAQRIRSIDPSAQIIVLTAFSDLQEFGRDACLSAHYLWKPVDIENLFAVVRQCSRTLRSSVGSS